MSRDLMQTTEPSLLVKFLTSMAALLLLLNFAVTLNAEPPDNVPPDGYEALFNGEHLNGWFENRKSNPKEPPSVEIAGWKVEDGAIVFQDVQGSEHLWSKRKFRSFILLVDWKFNGKGTTGIFCGPIHLKIWDTRKNKPPASQGSGSLGYGKDRVVPLKKADNPIGEWNHFKMMVQNNEVTVWLNDELIVDKAPKKFGREYPIGLQDHGTAVWFKNIFVKELSGRESTGE